MTGAPRLKHTRRPIGSRPSRTPPNSLYVWAHQWDADEVSARDEVTGEREIITARIPTPTRMPITTSAEFLDHYALDRQMLAEFVQMRSMTGNPGGMIQLGGRGSTTKILNAEFHDSISGQAIEEFKASMRPLFFGTAWRVIDGLIELALAQDGSTPSSARGWRADEKRRGLQQGYGTLGEMPPLLLDPVKALYVATIDIRHALIHRKTEIAADGSLVGFENNNAPLRAVQVPEQVHMCELAQWLALAIERHRLSRREQRRVLALLAALAGLHGQSISGAPLLSAVALVRFPLDETMELDLADIRRQAGGGHFGIDLEVVTPGGTFLVGDIDDLPDQTIKIDLANLPSWLGVRVRGADAP